MTHARSHAALIAVLVLAALSTGCRYAARPSTSRIDDIGAGDRVHLKTTAGHSLDGEVVSADSTALRIAGGEGAEPESVDVASIALLERRTSTDGHGIFLGIIGGAAGFVVGTYVGVTQADFNPFRDTGDDDTVILGAVTGTLLGAILGGIIGHHLTSERWESIETAGAGGPDVGIAGIWSAEVTCIDGRPALRLVATIRQ